MYHSLRWIAVAYVACVPPTLSGAEAPSATRENNRSIEHIYQAELRSPLLSNGGDTRIPACVGVLPPKSRETKSFLLPTFESVVMMVMGDSTLRYEFRSPSGKRFAPGETPDDEYFKSASLKGLKILRLERPESGAWSVTVDARDSRDSAAYGIDISTQGNVEEQPHLETFTRNSDPRFSHPVRPDSLIYVRAFLVKRDRIVPRTKWAVHVMTAEDSMKEIQVFDDGLHADGSAADGLFVGSIRGHGPDGIWRFVAEGVTPEGIRYAETSVLEVQDKYDLLVQQISVSPNPQAGKPVTLTVAVKNDGARAYKQVELRLYLRLGGEIWEEEVSRRVFDLKAGESRRVVTKWTPTSSDTYEVRLTIDPYLRAE